MDIRPPRTARVHSSTNSRTDIASNAAEPIALTPRQQTQSKKHKRTIGSVLPRSIGKVRNISVRKKYIVVITLVLLIVVSGFTIAARRTKEAPIKPQSYTNSELIENLEYQTVVPRGKAIGDLGGWRRVSPPENDPVYAFTDTIGDVPISVSQQPVPGPFIGDLDNRVTKLAKEYNATTLVYADGIKVYIGTSSKGPQSTIFTKNNLLILIKSQKKIDEQAWVQYIKSLN